MRIAVLGGGIAGLAAAFRLQREHEVTLFEARDRAGGNIRTEDLMGCRVESGPNGWLDNESATLELVRELGLEERLVRANRTVRLVWRAGKLRELPASPGGFLRSDCLPLLSRLRVLFEPWSRAAPGGDESVHDFAARHLGRGAARILVDAFVTGVFAGDPKRLSVRSAFPRLFALEQAHGSLLRGAKGRGFGPPGVLTSLDDGLEVLTDALAERVDLRLGQAGMPEGFERVVCTVPAPRAAALVTGELAGLLARIPTAPVAVVATVHETPLDVPEAFGFLVPHGEGLSILGTLYDSSIFAGRAPEGLRLFRTLLGGRRDPEAAALDDGATLEVVARDLHRVWGFFPEPKATRIFRHPLGIAQYEVGHSDLLARIEDACPEGLRLAGSSYRGVSINACVKEALDWRP